MLFEEAAVEKEAEVLYRCQGVKSYEAASGVQAAGKLAFADKDHHCSEIVEVHGAYWDDTVHPTNPLIESGALCDCCGVLLLLCFLLFVGCCCWFACVVVVSQQCRGTVIAWHGESSVVQRCCAHACGSGAMLVLWPCRRITSYWHHMGHVWTSCIEFRRVQPVGHMMSCPAIHVRTPQSVKLMF